MQKDDAISGCEALYSQPRDGKELIGLGNSKASNDTQSERIFLLGQSANQLRRRSSPVIVICPIALIDCMYVTYCYHGPGYPCGYVENGTDLDSLICKTCPVKHD